MPDIKKQLDGLLTQEMDRKSFLQYSGGIVLGLLGITGLIRIILSSNRLSSGPVTNANQPPVHGGYGSSRYGQ